MGTKCSVTIRAITPAVAAPVIAGHDVAVKFHVPASRPVPTQRPQLLPRRRCDAAVVCSVASLQSRCQRRLLVEGQGLDARDLIRDAGGGGHHGGQQVVQGRAIAAISAAISAAVSVPFCAALTSAGAVTCFAPHAVKQCTRVGVVIRRVLNARRRCSGCLASQAHSGPRVLS